MQHTTRIGRVTTQYHHEVIVDGVDVGAVLETTGIADNGMERTYSAHRRFGDMSSRMLSTDLRATFAECVALVVAEYAAHVNAPIVDAANAAAESVKS